MSTQETGFEYVDGLDKHTNELSRTHISAHQWTLTV